MDTIFLLVLFSGFTCAISGQVVERIKGPGVLDTTPGEFPYFVNILDRWTRELIGSGILIESRVILTSGFDYIDKSIYNLVVYLGEYDRADLAERSKQVFEVSKILLHPKLTPKNSWTSDIALLQLKTEPVLNENVKTFGVGNIVKSSKEDKNIHKKRGACVVPGFGFIKWDIFQTLLPTTMKKFVPTMISPSQCFPELPNDIFLCSQNVDSTKTCKYDNGTPLLCKNKGKTKLYGLTMAGYGFSRYCDDGRSMFTRISLNYKWIKKNVRSLQKGEP